MENKLFRHDGDLTEKDIVDFVNLHKSTVIPRLQRLKDYYLGNHAILNKQYDAFKPDARLVNNFASYITDISTSYFMGTPVAYSGSEEDKAKVELINSVLKFNDSADNDTRLAEDLSIYGTAFELWYIDKESLIDTRFAVIDPREIFVVYDYALEPNPIMAIRHYAGSNKKGVIEVYTKEAIDTYVTGSGSELTLVSSVEHFFGDVPVVQIWNNNSLMGDFERVISLIDEYNELQSGTANDFAYFSDAYLFLSGASIDESTAVSMRENRLINIEDPDAKAEWLIKNIQDTALENYKNRLVNDIHKFTNVPNLTDESFASNLSGVAIKYKLLGLENLANAKERKFKKGLQRRLELLFNLFYTRGLVNSPDYMSINITFKRTLPANLLDEAEVAMKLQGIVSLDTLLNNLSFVEDVVAEKEKIKEEKATSNAFLDEAYTSKILGLETSQE